MCTLMLAHKPTPGTLLAVSANRNEFLARPASPMAVWPGSGIVAPRDEQGGGTWLGVNPHGVFVGLTNRSLSAIDAGRPSRGRLVLAALECGSARAVFDLLGGLEGNEHNGFHLVAADRSAAFLAICDGTTIERRELPQGVHVITERSFGAGEGRREERVRPAFDALFSAGEPTLEELRRPMQLHSDVESPLEGACVHAELLGYGTRSSFQLLLPVSGAAGGSWSEGPTCTAKVVDVSPLVAPLFAAPG
jgi:uncharacterized protein with NRDE domain